MTVRYESGVVVLEGRCLAEDAEELLLVLREKPSVEVDLHGVQRMHMAVAQVLLALRPRLRGTPAQPFLAKHLFAER